MLVTMKTSWRDHRPHAIANLAFRTSSAAGFALGLLATLVHRFATAPPACDVQHAPCLLRVIRYEAIAHVAPPVAGLLVGMILGAWMAQAVRGYART
jgi:hypothetical protein